MLTSFHSSELNFWNLPIVAIVTTVTEGDMEIGTVCGFGWENAVGGNFRPGGVVDIGAIEIDGVVFFCLSVRHVAVLVTHHKGDVVVTVEPADDGGDKPAVDAGSLLVPDGESMACSIVEPAFITQY